MRDGERERERANVREKVVEGVREADNSLSERGKKDGKREYVRVRE